MPCRRCVSKRYVCGNKTLGPKSQLVDEGKQLEFNVAPSTAVVHRALETPSDQLLRPNDLFYLQYYECNLHNIKPNHTRLIFGPGYILHICSHYFDITSKPFRAAILAFASLAMPKERHANTNDDTNAYYAIFYRAAAEAIDKKDVTSLVYASYIMAMIGLLYEASTYNALAHCSQFCRALLPYSERGLSVKEWAWSSRAWRLILWSACSRFWFDQYHRRWHEHSFRVHYKGNDFLFNGFRRRSCGDAAAWSRSPNLNKLTEILIISDAYMHQRDAEWFSPYQTLFINAIYMQIYIEKCLFDALYTQQMAASSFTETLHSALVRNIDLIENTRWPRPVDRLDDWLRCHETISGMTLPDPTPDLNHNPTGTPGDSQVVYSDDTWVVDLFNVYICSRMLLNLLCCDIDHKTEDESETLRSALATVYVLSSTVSQFSRYPGPAALFRRSLFWAGLILYKAGHRQGIRCLQPRMLTYRRKTLPSTTLRVAFPLFNMAGRQKTALSRRIFRFHGSNRAMSYVG